MSLKARLETVRANLKAKKDQITTTPPDLVQARASPRMWGVPFAVAGALGVAVLFQPAQAATVDFSNISDLLNAVVTLIPSFMALVIEMAPLIVTIAIISFVIAFLDRILQMLKF